MEMMSSGCYMIDGEYTLINVNETAKAIYPQLELGKKCYTCLMGLEEPCGPCPVKNGKKGPNTYTDPIRGISETVDALDLEIPGKGLCHALVFSTVGRRAQLAATLPTDTEDLENLALIKALTADFLDVFSVDLSAGRITLYRHNGQPLPAESVYRNIISYPEGIEHYIDQHVFEEDKERVRRENSIAYIREELKESETLQVHYRVLLSDGIHYFFRKIVRIGDAAHFDAVMIGVACEDEEVRSRLHSLELEKNLSEMEYDPLTGLYTRAAFLIRGEELLRRFPDRRFDFCISRIENLLAINHQYGRAQGDEVIALMGRLLRRYARIETNCVTYLGNGTFASFTENTPRIVRESEVLGFRDEMLRQCKIPEVSLKWSIYTDVSRDMSIAEIMEKTNYALSTIRQNTHQDYVEFDQTVIDRMAWEEYVEKVFRISLQAGEFVTWYQPKYSIRTGRIEGAEALVRWKRPDGSMIPPGRFIPVLETYGGISELDEEIFRQVCAFQKKLREAGMPSLPISVNLSRASMFRQDLADVYSRIADGCGVERELLPIEITESAAIRSSSIRELAASLVNRGFPLHMDDFGSGYSSLASLQTIPFDSIKLDKTLIDLIGGESNDNLLKHTIAFARESGKTVVAEGVEHYEQYLFLKVVGCDLVQGYYFSKPVEEEIFCDMLREDTAGKRLI